MDELVVDENNPDQFYDEYFTPRVPVLIKGGISNWPLMDKWSPEYISESCGDYSCTVVSDGRPAYSKRQTTLRAYFEDPGEDSTLTLEELLPDNLPYFFNDIPFPNAYFGPQNVRRYFFFHSHKDGGTLPHLHHDAFNMLQTGEKRWILHDAGRQSCPPGNAVMRGYMEKYPVGATAKDWFANELEDLPGKVDKVYDCVQEAGDIVYIPVEFSHTVLNNSEVMGLVVERNRLG